MSDIPIDRQTQITKAIQNTIHTPPTHTPHTPTPHTYTPHTHPTHTPHTHTSHTVHYYSRSVWLYVQCSDMLCSRWADKPDQQAGW